jgi:DNA-binding NarL/FixJ family response regulator
MDVAEESTIKNRLKTIFSKLGVSKRVQAAKIPMDYGFAGKSVPLTRSNE